MRRKWGAAALAALLALTLAACGQKPAEAPKEPAPAPETAPEENLPEPGTDAPENPSEEVQAVLPPRVAVTVAPQTREYADDDGSLLLVESIPTISVTIEGSAAAEEAVNQALSDRYLDRMELVQSYLDGAREEKRLRGEAGSAFSGFAITQKARAARLDEAVVSVVYTNVDATGGAHGSVAGAAVNFSASDGRLLTLEDLTDDVGALNERVAAAAAAQIDAEPDRYFPGAAGLAGTLLEDGSWYFSDEGLVVLCNPYYLASFAAGVLEFPVPYAALEGVLREAWMPAAPEALEGALEIAPTGDAGPDGGLLELTSDAEAPVLRLTAEGAVRNVRVLQVSSADGAVWTAGDEYLALNRMGPEDEVCIRTWLPDAMPNLAVACTLADGTAAYYGVCQSGKDGSVFLQRLETVES